MEAHHSSWQNWRIEVCGIVSKVTPQNKTGSYFRVPCLGLDPPPLPPWLDPSTLVRCNRPVAGGQEGGGPGTKGV